VEHQGENWEGGEKACWKIVVGWVDKSQSNKGGLSFLGEKGMKGKPLDQLKKKKRIYPMGRSADEGEGLQSMRTV